MHNKIKYIFLKKKYIFQHKGIELSGHKNKLTGREKNDNIQHDLKDWIFEESKTMALDSDN